MQCALCYSGTRFLSTDVLVDSVLISFYAVLFMLERVCTLNLRRSFEHNVQQTILFLPPIIIFGPYSFLKPLFLVYEGFT